MLRMCLVVDMWACSLCMCVDGVCVRPTFVSTCSQFQCLFIRRIHAIFQLQFLFRFISILFQSFIESLFNCHAKVVGIWFQFYSGTDDNKVGRIPSPFLFKLRTSMKMNTMRSFTLKSCQGNRHTKNLISNQRNATESNPIFTENSICSLTAMFESLWLKRPIFTKVNSNSSEKEKKLRWPINRQTYSTMN